jgi:hypothetical protein
MPRIGLLAKPKSTPNRQCSTVLHPCHQEVPHKVWYIVFLTFGLAGRARVFRRRRGDSDREERLPGLSTAAVNMVSAPERGFARILRFQLASGSFSAHFQRCGRISRIFAPGSNPRWPELCIWFRVCAFHRQAPINGVRMHALLVATVCLVACFGGF